MNAANQYINGNYQTSDGKTLTVNVALTNGPGGTVIHNAAVTPGESPRSYAEVGGNNVYLHDGADSYSGAHEIAHNLGLHDSYTETPAGVVTNQPGLMGTYGDHMNATEATALYNNYCNSNVPVQIIGGGGGGGHNMAMDSMSLDGMELGSGGCLYSWD